MATNRARSNRKNTFYFPTCDGKLISQMKTICDDLHNNLNNFVGTFHKFLSRLSAAKIPVRLNVGVMLFMASFTSYMLRVNFSIIIIAMTKPIMPNGTASLMETDNGSFVDDSFNWSKKEEGLLLSAYFYGYIFPNLLGGFLSEKFGGRKVIFTGMLLSAVITGLSPLAANDNFIYMFASRLVLGVMGVSLTLQIQRTLLTKTFQGFLYPACHNIISKWSPLEEKGKFVSALLGGTLGTVLTWPLTGLIIEKFGWRYGFYVSAVFALLMAFLWFYFVSDSPANHPRITKREKDLIEKSLGSTITTGKKSSWPPMKQMLLSPQFYALLVLHFGSTWGLFFLITAAPKFMSEVLKFKLTEAGILSSLPYLMRLIFGFVFGSIGDRIRHKNVLSVTTIRKMFCVFCKWTKHVATP